MGGGVADPGFQKILDTFFYDKDGNAQPVTDFNTFWIYLLTQNNPAIKHPGGQIKKIMANHFAQNPHYPKHDGVSFSDTNSAPGDMIQLLGGAPRINDYRVTANGLSFTDVTNAFPAVPGSPSPNIVHDNNCNTFMLSDGSMEPCITKQWEDGG